MITQERIATYVLALLSPARRLRADMHRQVISMGIPGGAKLKRLRRPILGASQVLVPKRVLVERPLFETFAVCVEIVRMGNIAIGGRWPVAACPILEGDLGEAAVRSGSYFSSKAHNPPSADASPLSKIGHSFLSLPSIDHRGSSIAAAHRWSLALWRRESGRRRRRRSGDAGTSRW